LNVFNERLRNQGIVNQPTITPPQPPSDNYYVEGQYTNSHPGTSTTPGNTAIPGRPAPPDVTLRAVGNSDRNRPPGIPRKGSDHSPQRPSMTPGVPYNPQPQAGSRPPRFPPRKDENLP
ncbi:MAG: hypothetical protein CUN56_14595, partial [Phototrophicales bacterium]